MGNPGDNGRKRWDPERWADEANEYFLAMARSLMSFISWEPAAGPAGGKAGGNGNPGTKPAGGAARPGQPAVNLDALKSLADKIDRTLRGGPKRDLFEIADDHEPETPAYELSLRESYKDLFHHTAERRISAVRYIQERKQVDAIPLLESICAIEESEEVRKEITRAVVGLRAARKDKQYGARYAG